MKSKTLEAQICYEFHNQWLRRALKTTKDKFYRRKLQQSEGDSKEAWRHVNTYLRGKRNTGTLDPRLVGETVNGVNAYSADLGSDLGSADPQERPLEDFGLRRGICFRSSSHSSLVLFDSRLATKFRAFSVDLTSESLRGSMEYQEDC